MVPELLLLGPGPSPVSPSTAAAQSQPLVGHLDPVFLELMDRVQGDLRRVFGTANRFTMPVSGTGSAGMELCLLNLVEPGDRVVIGTHGVFGGRMRDLATRLGADVVEVTSEFGDPLDQASLIDAIQGGATKLVAFVHAETSTGVLTDPTALTQAARDAGALVLLDCVTSLAGTAVELDKWGVDAAFAGTQKCLSVPPGLAPVSLSDRALKRIAERRERPGTWYLDVGLLDGYWGGERVYHHTAPISMIYALEQGLREALDEGLEPRFARHRDVAQALYRGLEPLGLTCLVDEGHRTPMLTTVVLPEGIDEVRARSVLRGRHLIEVGGGLGALKGRVWRIGLMGYGAECSSVMRVVAAMGCVLGEAGCRVDVGAALRVVAEG